jgi:hypothetical protein
MRNLHDVSTMHDTSRITAQPFIGWDPGRYETQVTGRFVRVPLRNAFYDWHDPLGRDNQPFMDFEEVDVAAVVGRLTRLSDRIRWSGIDPETVSLRLMRNEFRALRYAHILREGALLQFNGIRLDVVPD